MKEIDQKLDQWVYSNIIRAEIRELIVKELEKAQMYGYEVALKVNGQINYKLNTNTNG